MTELTEIDVDNILGNTPADELAEKKQRRELDTKKEERAIKYSYTRLSTYKQCPFRYKLQYIDGNYSEKSTLAMELGTLIHKIEQRINLALQEGVAPDYGQLKYDLEHYNIPKKNKYDQEGGIYGLEILKKKYRKDFYALNDKGESYDTKCNRYMSTGIYRQEQFLKEHPELEPCACEQYFEMLYAGKFIIKGYIDRIWRNKETGEYVIEDIKTRDKLYDKDDVTTPLQHCIYSLGITDAWGLSSEPTQFNFDLPLIDVRQPVGTKGCLTRTKKKLNEIFTGIQNEDFHPSPSPLCHWCQFCGTNEDCQETKNYLCPYYSLYTKERPDHSVLNKWEGPENHERIMEHFLKDQLGIKGQEDHGITVKSFDFDF